MSHQQILTGKSLTAVTNVRLFFGIYPECQASYQVKVGDYSSYVYERVFGDARSERIGDDSLNIEGHSGHICVGGASCADVHLEAK